MTPEYIAGFFDGEGTLYAKPTNRVGRPNSLSFIVKIYQSELDVLYEIKKFLDSLEIRSYIRGPLKNGGLGSRLMYTLSMETLIDCMSFLILVAPHCIVKRKKTLEVCRVIMERECKFKGNLERFEVMKNMAKVILNIIEVRQ